MKNKQSTSIWMTGLSLLTLALLVLGAQSAMSATKSTVKAVNEPPRLTIKPSDIVTVQPDLEKAIDSKLSEASETLPAKVNTNAVSVGAQGSLSEEKASPSANEAMTEGAGDLKRAKSAAASEAEMPINVKKDFIKKTSQDFTTRAVLTVIVLLGLVGGLTWFGRKWAHNQKTKSKYTQIKVLTQHYLGPKKSLAIVSVAGESILIGVTDHNISMLKTLSLLEEEIPEEVPAHFGLTMKSHQDRADEPADENEMFGENDREEFSIRGIRDFVSDRIKNRRTHA